MPDLFSSKEKLRSLFLKIRNDLNQNIVNDKSRQIVDKVLSSREFGNASAIHSYVSIRENNEVDTYSIIDEARALGKKVIVPKIAGKGKLEHIVINSVDELKMNHWGVPEPQKGKIFSIDDLDLVIVPMVAGDYQKNRLGYGKGYYDRFLDNCPALKMGLLFDCQLYENELPVESFDIPLDILITETQRIE